MADLNDAKVLVVGSGISAKGAENALKRRKIYCIAAEKDEAAKLLRKQAFDLVVVSPSIPLGDAIFGMAEERGIRTVGEIELGYMLFDGVIAAVTGTNGKTTVSKMLALMLSARYKTELCGNIGKSFALTAAEGECEAAVVEVSSFQLETIRAFHPHVAIITNISEDHLDRHANMENYAALKKRIAANQTKEDTLVLSQDGIPLKYLTDFSPAAHVIFACARGKIDGAYMDGGKFYYYDEYIASEDNLPFREKFNYGNFLLAASAARAMGVSCGEIRRSMADFKPEPHRFALIRVLNGVNFYDDSKATNVGAALAALGEMQGSVCLIAGGSEKNCGYEKLFSTRAQLCKLNLIGRTKRKIRDAAYIGGFSNVELFDTLDKAVENAYESGCRNVLFSPACASFDMFENYAERGERFAEIVNALV